MGLDHRHDASRICRVNLKETSPHVSTPRLGRVNPSHTNFGLPFRTIAKNVRRSSLRNWGGVIATLECRSVQPGVASAAVEVDGISDAEVAHYRQELTRLISAGGQVSDAVALVFVELVRHCPAANPSDLWQHVIYRHTLSLGWNDAQWKRVSGFALERALVATYQPKLMPRGLKMHIVKSAEANRALAKIGINDVKATKVDLFVEGLSVGSALAEKPSGGVIWISVTLGLELGPFWWFGGEPGEPLPDLSDFASPKRIGRNKEGERPLRANHRKVPARYFLRIETIDAMLETLFGPLPTGQAPVVVEKG